MDTVKRIITGATALVLVGLPTMSHAAIDLTTAGTGAATQAQDGAESALPIFIALVGIGVAVMGFNKLRRG